MDPKRGILCSGPHGPSWSSLLNRELGVDIKDLSYDAELLQEDVCVRYLASFKSRKIDDYVVGELIQARTWQKYNTLEVSQPTVIWSESNQVIAVGDGIWTNSYSSCLSEGETLASGMTR